jgi:hypothetical protein
VAHAKIAAFVRTEMFPADYLVLRMALQLRKADWRNATIDLWRQRD